MTALRIHGNVPFKTVLIHGGPGAAGEMGAVARRISADMGVLEPFQTADSVDGQVEELHGILHTHGDLPACLAGYSWGAWLAWIYAATYPADVKKLILISSGGFRAEHGEMVQDIRRQRLNDNQRAEMTRLLHVINDPEAPGRNEAFRRFGALFEGTDTFELDTNIQCEPDDMQFSEVIFQRVWQEADAMRATGKLLDYAERIRCPVVAIHGDYDPHPAEGVKKPLVQRIDEFKFILLEKCGHKPWVEKHAREEFFQTLIFELRS